MFLHLSKHMLKEGLHAEHVFEIMDKVSDLLLLLLLLLLLTPPPRRTRTAC